MRKDHRVAEWVAIVWLLAVFVSGLMVWSCEENNYETPTEPGPIQVYPNGRVVSPDAGQLSCEDDSRTNPPGHITIVEWVVREPSGATADSGNTAQHGEVLFSGLAPGKYTVEQTPHLDTGEPGPTKTYSRDVE